jgi:hypothetical protein
METQGRAKGMTGQNRGDRRAHHKPGKIGCCGKLLGTGMGGDYAHFGDVSVEGFASLFCEAANGKRIFPFEGFFDVNVVRFFEFREVARELSGSEQQRRREDGLGVRE